MTHMRIDTPIGELTLIARDGALAGVNFAGYGLPAGSAEGTEPVLEAAAEQLREYFAGERTAFDLPLALDGTPFQQEAWRARHQARGGGRRDVRSTILNGRTSRTAPPQRSRSAATVAG